mmetsp:Transcript_21852/g.76683  ORF Transcript_21852/g.76683 Transcript_21852/m.76683 type:complete len:210 (-) Transcript_21852:3234-3863(-)
MPIQLESSLASPCVIAFTTPWTGTTISMLSTPRPVPTPANSVTVGHGHTMASQCVNVAICAGAMVISTMLPVSFSCMIISMKRLGSSRKMGNLTLSGWSPSEFCPVVTPPHALSTSAWCSAYNGPAHGKPLLACRRRLCADSLGMGRGSTWPQSISMSSINRCSGAHASGPLKSSAIAMKSDSCSSMYRNASIASYAPLNTHWPSHMCS